MGMTPHQRRPRQRWCKHRWRRRLQRILIVLTLSAFFGSWSAVHRRIQILPSRHKSEKKVEHSLSDTQKERSCASLLMHQARRPVEVSQRRNSTPVLGALGQLADIEFVAKCWATLDNWKSVLELRRHQHIGLAEFALAHDMSNAIHLPNADCSLDDFFKTEALDTLLDDDLMQQAKEEETLLPNANEKISDKCPSPYTEFDVVILHTSNHSDFQQLLLDAENSLHVATRGILLININSQAAQLLLLLLRARYDIDVASADTYDGGFAVILKQSNRTPLRVEALPPDVVQALEWPRSEAGGARNPLVAREKAKTLLQLDRKTQRALLNLIDLDSLFAWISLKQHFNDDHYRQSEAMRIFGGGDLVLLALDVAKWRDACFKQLIPTKDQPNAADCFRALADTQQFARLARSDGNLRRKSGLSDHHAFPPTKRPADLLPYALVLASQGHAAKAADAFAAAYEINPSWTRLALLKIAHSFADLPVSY